MNIRAKEYYDVDDVIAAECNLEPIKCRFCDSLEVNYMQYIGDAHCPICGKWQLEETTYIEEK